MKYCNFALGRSGKPETEHGLPDTTESNADVRKKPETVAKRLRRVGGLIDWPGLH